MNVVDSCGWLEYFAKGTGLGKPAGRPCHGTSDFGCERELIMNFRAISCLSWQKNIETVDALRRSAALIHPTPTTGDGKGVA
jgi:hypothetical protein